MKMRKYGLAGRWPFSLGWPRRDLEPARNGASAEPSDGHEEGFAKLRMARNGASAEPSDGHEEGSAKLRMTRNGASAEPNGISVLLKTARSQVGLDLWCGGRISNQVDRECT